MPQQVKKFSGVLNLDDPDATISSVHHKYAKNGLFVGIAPELQFQSIVGNSLVPNSFLPVTGINITIGRHYDEIKDRIFFFNYNSLFGSAIYILNRDETVQRLIATDPSYADFLNFNPDTPITSIDILYNDDVDGDILYYIDSLKRPTQINIPRYLANTYNPIKRAFINVIKAPFSMPIKCVYENDNSVTVNNLNGLYQFICRPVYDNLEKSVWSSGSAVPLPYSGNFDLIQNQRSQNAKIVLYLQTGDVDVKRIEVAMRNGTGTNPSAWLLVTVLNKADLGIADNTVYRYEFFNDGVYNEIDPKEQVLDYDYVPDEANAGVLLNGNVPAYAAIKEGHDIVNVGMSASSSSPSKLNEVPGTLFFGIQGNDDSLGTGNNLTLYLTGAGDGSLSDPILFNTVGTFIVHAVDSLGNNIGFNYANASNVNTSVIFTALTALATGQGFTFVSQTYNTITYSFTGYQLQSVYLEFDQTLSPANSTSGVVSSSQYAAAYRYAIGYRDANGKTNGAITTANAKVTTVTHQAATGVYNPQITVQIDSRPPIWATDWQLLRSDQLTYDKEFYWVSKGAYADPLTLDTRYAYIDISNIADFNRDLGRETNNPNAGVSYEFIVGDRIKFLIRYPFTGSPSPMTAAEYDYEIVGTSFSVIANNVAVTGTFLKIKYPTADIGANFDFNTINFQNYKIFIYGYSKHVSEKVLTYYEIGYRHKIGNAGTGGAYHIAKDQTQSVDLTTPAIEKISSGDEYFRYRTVPVGDTYTFQVLENDQDSDTYLLVQVPNSPITTSKYTLQTQPDDAAFNDPTKTLYHNLTAANAQIRFKGDIPLYNGSEGCDFELYVTTYNVTSTEIVLVSGSIPQGSIKTFSFDAIVNVTLPREYAFIAIRPTTGVSFNALIVKPFQLQVTVVRSPIIISVIEPTYNDIGRVELPSNSRPLVVDENAKREFKSTLFRFANPRQQGTNINQSNRFYPNNTDEFDRQWGEVVRMMINGRQLEIFQYANTGVVGVYGKFIKDKAGSSNLITTDEIITPNNIQYYNGGYGIRNQPTALSKNGYVFYFPDILMGTLCRLSESGIVAISDDYKVQTWAGENLPKYAKDSNYEFGGKSRVLSTFNQLTDRHGEVLFVLQKGNIDGTVDKQPFTISFDEKRNAFTSFYDYFPDQIICAGNRLISFYGGRIYKHTNTSQYANFYGVQYDTEIESPFNDYLLDKKTWEALTEISGDVWVCPSIYTNVDSYKIPSPQRQESVLIIQDFKQLEQDWHADFLRDSNSIKGLLSGDFLKGNYIVIKFMAKDSSKFSYLSEISVKYIGSALTAP